MKTLILILNLLIIVPVFGQDSIANKQERIRNYYRSLAVYKSTLADLQRLGINPFQPDLSQAGGGLPFQVFVETKAYLEREEQLLGLNNKIQDGWYEATVEYSNYSTGTRSKYTLDVEVKDDRVVTISFGNGKSVHTGYNSSGYIYSGGSLDFEYNLNNQATSATTKVTITTGSSTYYYKILIE